MKIINEDIKSLSFAKIKDEMSKISIINEYKNNNYGLNAISERMF